MENQEPSAREALAEVERVRQTNEEHLRRPGHYWAMIGVFFAVFALAPLSWDFVPAPYGYVLPVAAVPVIAVLFMWRKRPGAMRIRYQLDEAMNWQILRFVSPLVAIWAVNTGLYAFFGWWWVPPLSAVAMFVTAFTRARAMDRRWAHTVSHRV